MLLEQRPNLSAEINVAGGVDDVDEVRGECSTCVGHLKAQRNAGRLDRNAALGVKIAKSDTMERAARDHLNVDTVPLPRRRGLG